MERMHRGKRISVTSEQDGYRPFFQRKCGELGVWIDVHSAEPEKKGDFGSQQYFLMDLKERFYDELNKTDMHKVKGFFEKRSILRDFSLMKYVKGVLLVCHSNIPESLQRLIEDYDSGKLQSCATECFATVQIQKALKVTGLKLTVKLMEDEIDLVEEEWRLQKLPLRIQHWDDVDHEARILLHLTRYQNTSLAHTILNLNDLTESYRGSFHALLDLLKDIYLAEEDEDAWQELKNLRGFNALAKRIQTSRNHNDMSKKLLQSFATALNATEKCVRDIETNVAFPLLQMREGVDTAEQANQRRHLCHLISEMKKYFHEIHEFTSESSSEWADQLMPGDQLKYGGLLCLMPTTTHKIIDVDHILDDYLQHDNFSKVLAQLKL